MELSKQVVSLELAKKLKELDFTQNSLFYWVLYYGTDHGQNCLDTAEWGIRINGNWQGDKSCLGIADTMSAFTVAELFEFVADRGMDIWLYYDGKKYSAETKSKKFSNSSENLADFLAGMLIEYETGRSQRKDRRIRNEKQNTRGN